MQTYTTPSFRSMKQSSQAWNCLTNSFCVISNIFWKLSDNPFTLQIFSVSNVFKRNITKIFQKVRALYAICPSGQTNTQTNHQTNILAIIQILASNKATRVKNITSPYGEGNNCPSLSWYLLLKGVPSVCTHTIFYAWSSCFDITLIKSTYVDIDPT